MNFFEKLFDKHQTAHLTAGAVEVVLDVNRSRQLSNEFVSGSLNFRRQTLDLVRVAVGILERLAPHHLLHQKIARHARVGFSADIHTCILQQKRCSRHRIDECVARFIDATGPLLGHTPFGHAGEKALSSMLDKPFRHNEQSLRVVDKLERDGAGLNLTYEVRMGILGHTGDFIPETLEGQIVRTSDRIAYINHDIDDAMRAGILTEADIPPEIAEILGHSHSQRINTLVENMIDNTIATGTLGMQPEIAQAMDRLRTFMFARVYTNPVAKGEEAKAKDMLCRLFEYYMRRPEKLPADFLPQLDFDGMERIVCDYIAGMTDRYAVYKYSELFIPTTWQVR